MLTTATNQNFPRSELVINGAPWLLVTMPPEFGTVTALSRDTRTAYVADTGDADLNAELAREAVRLTE